LERRKSSYSFGDLAKECNKRGLKIKGPTIMEFLKSNGYLRKPDGMPFTLPTDISYAQALMDCEKAKHGRYTVVYAVLTPKGFEYFTDLILEHYKVPNKLF